MTLERPWVVVKQTVLAAVLIVLPLLYTQVPPLEDYPNHLARTFALAQIPGNEVLSQFYQVDWAPIPNLIMDLLVPPLAPLFGIYAAGRIFVGAVLLLLLLGPMVLHRAIYARWSAWPLVGGLFVYNGYLFVGLMNYLFGVGVAIFGLAAWVWLAERNVLLRALCSLVFCALLYVCHLSALGLYGLSIAGYEAWRLWDGRRYSLKDLATSGFALLAPILPALYLLLNSPTWGLSRELDWESQGKVQAITRFLTVYTDLIDIPFLILIGAAIVVAVRRGLVRMHPAGLVVLGALVTAFLVMPRMAFGSFMADERLVVGIFFIPLGFIATDLRKLEGQNAFLAICLVTIAIRVVDVSVNWSLITQPVMELKRAFRFVEPGSRILVIEADATGEGPVAGSMSHAPTLAVIDRSALVSRLFVVQGKQILHARPGVHDHVDTEDGDTPTVSQLLLAARKAKGAIDDPKYFDRWQDFYDFVIVLGEEVDPTELDSATLSHVAAGRAFAMYRVRKPA